MSKSVITLIILLFLSGCKNSRDIWLFSTFREPATEGLYLAWSEDGLTWNDLGGPWLRPEAGPGRVMRDPSVLRGPDGTYHMVWTSSWKDDQGFGYANSADLINWSEQKWIPVMQHEPATVNVWAPELWYDEVKEHFVIIWASCIPFRFPRGEEEEMSNHRMYVTTTKDFRTFSPTELFLDPGFSVIDAVIVKRAENDFVLVLKDNTRPNRNLRVAFSTKASGPYTGISDTFTRMYTEGPTVLKKDDYWLIFYEAYRERLFGAVKTTDFKTFTDISDKISLPAGHKHGTIFRAGRKTLKGLQQEYERRTANQGSNEK
ncbi:MAG TPA: glycoside hydrolase family 43 protein [Bacteroidales bacterium]|nr:glycoside hydrolase family 43 protein [Bacteroidales bacterium]